MNPVTNPYTPIEHEREWDFNDMVDQMAQAKQVGGSHYISLPIPPWDAMQAWFPESFKDYLLMNAIKYIARNKLDKREDVEKAKHCLEKWLEVTSS